MDDVFTRKTIRCKIRFERYIAHPYWPERERVIKIQLHSGMNRLKSDDKKRDALRGQCEKEGITLEDYEALLEKAAQQWYRSGNGDDKSQIMIPRHQLAGCLVEATGRFPKAIRGQYEKESFRHYVRISDFTTNKTEADGVFDRYVKLENSNKRDHQRNEYIENFVAEGTFAVPGDTKLEDLKRLVMNAIERVGVGASRKMGFGRGKVVEFKEE